MMFSLDELALTAAAAFATAVHVCLGLLAWDSAGNNRSYNHLYLAFACVVAFFCMSEGYAQSGIFRYQNFWVPAPLLAGFAFPLVFLITHFHTESGFQLQRRHLLWLLPGGFGSIYSLLTLALSESSSLLLYESYKKSGFLKLITSQVEHPEDGFIFQGLLISLCLHLLSMSSFIVLIAYRLYRAKKKTDYSQAQREVLWITLPLGVGTFCLIISALLPALLEDLNSMVLGPISTIPLGYLLYGAMRRRQKHYTHIQRQQKELARYLPSPLVDLIMKSQKNELGGDEATGTVMFADIRNFTSLSEKLPARLVVELLNSYLAVMNEIIHKHSGVINKYTGDGILVVFGLEKEPYIGCNQAFQCAREMLEGLESLNLEVSKKGYKPLRIGIGIHFGVLVHGSIGSEDRKEYTLIGDTVNTASRITSMAGKLGESLLLSEEVYIHINEGQGLLNFNDEVTLRGRSKPTRVYRLKLDEDSSIEHVAS